MELSHLKYFKIAAKYESMTKAAAELNISQPALSKTISRLEDKLGAPLFFRNGKQIKLNNFGRVFLERVNRIIYEIDESVKTIKDMNSLESGAISFTMTLPHIMPTFLGEFLKRYPNAKINHNQASSVEMKELLENAKVDLCISTTPIMGANIEWLPLIEEKIYLSVPYEHPLAQRNSVFLNELTEERFIGLKKGYGFRDITDFYCNQAGFTPKTDIELEESGSIQTLVELGFGVAFIPSLSILKDSAPKTKRVRIKDEHCKRIIGIAWSPKHYQSQAAKAFRDFTILFFKELAEGYYLKE
ncbi:LysR family transcriptional regulator [Cytobacillus kochii]|uniref:LysR family transcriptional regulator n=1 Tax=Cytobacillus kochii TaxID=859143 RepID=UPI002E22248B|nr:LysR family transcriptional regulator [Cytobacillus kochii]